MPKPRNWRYNTTAASLNHALKTASSPEYAEGVLEGARVIATMFAAEPSTSFQRQRFFNAVTKDTDHDL